MTHNYPPIEEVLEPGEPWVPESLKAQLVVGALVRVRLGECPLVGRWHEMDGNHTGCHLDNVNGHLARIVSTTFHAEHHHNYEVDFRAPFPVDYDGLLVCSGHYCAAELEPVAIEEVAP